MRRGIAILAKKAQRSIRGRLFLSLLLVLLFAGVAESFGQAAASLSAPQTALPRTWIDADTGHRVTRISDDPSSKGLYFSHNAYTPDGSEMIYLAPKGIYNLNLSTLKSELLVSGKVSSVLVGTKTRRVFYQNDADGYYYSIDLDSRHATQLRPLPVRGVAHSLNADETLLVGTIVEGTAPQFDQYKVQALRDALQATVENSQTVIAAKSAQIEAHPEEKVTGHEGDRDLAKAKADAEEKRFEAHSAEDIFTLNLQTGEVKIILRGTDWLSHVQFSPTDPGLIMYAHEGPALKVDRIWTIRADGSRNRLMHKRADPSEIATHEFWGADGKTIWYDLQKSKGQTFTLAGTDVETGKETVYGLKKAEASVHYNVSPDGSAFCGDGNSAAITHSGDGGEGRTTLDRKWIELLTPGDGGTLQSTRLAHIPGNDYAKTEPNARFSPDGKSVIFTSNMFGSTYVFAVEIDKPAAN